MVPHSAHRHHPRSLVWRRLRPKQRVFAFKGTATPAAAHSPDDRATRISLCASVRKDDETVDFTATGSVDDGDMQDIYGAPPTPWRGHRVIGTDALLRPEPYPAQPANDAHQQLNRSPPHGRAPTTSDAHGRDPLSGYDGADKDEEGSERLTSPTVGVDARVDPLTELESLAGSGDDDDVNMSAGDDEADPPHHTDTRAHPHAAQSHHGGAHNNHPSPRGPRNPRHRRRRMVPHPHRPHRLVLLGRQRRLHP